MSVKHFFEQETYTEEYLLPHFERHIPGFSDTGNKVLEIGCAEGGLLSIFTKRGYQADGVELEASRAAIAKERLPHPERVIVGDITDPLLEEQLDGPYDIIVMREVIEHILDKPAAVEMIFSLLKPGGYLFITFPLKYSPFSGHQQIAGKPLKYALYISLYPTRLIRLLGKRFTTEAATREILYLKKCLITFGLLQRLIKGKGEVRHVDFFISRPIYRYRFGFRTIRMPNIPVLRELAMGCEAFVQAN